MYERTIKKIVIFHNRLLSGKTRQVENSLFQQEPLPVFVYYTPLPVNGFELGPEETSRTYMFVTSIDSEQARAKRSFDYGKLEVIFIMLNKIIDSFDYSFQRTTPRSDLVDSCISME